MKTITNKTYLTALVILITTILPHSAFATFSIIACDKSTKVCAAAVATNNLAVGSSVIHVKAGVGAIASQFETNPKHGPTGLEMLAQKEDINSVLSELLKNDTFDGGGTEDRQLAILNLEGDVAIHTGKHVKGSQWTGSLSGKHYSIQGNGLKGATVLRAMEKTFLNTKGSLGERVIQALRSGQLAGGQTSGSMSSAVVVKTIQGFPHDIDLRVDYSESPVEDLYQLFNFHHARQAIIRAERNARQGKQNEVWNSVAEALHLGATWDRIWRRAARLAIRLDEKERALEYLGVFMALNPEWCRKEITQEIYASLRDNQLFSSWLNTP